MSKHFPVAMNKRGDVTVRGGAFTVRGTMLAGTVRIFGKDVEPLDVSLPWAASMHAACRSWTAKHWIYTGRIYEHNDGCFTWWLAVNENSVYRCGTFHLVTAAKALDKAMVGHIMNPARLEELEL